MSNNKDDIYQNLLPPEAVLTVSKLEEGLNQVLSNHKNKVQDSYTDTVNTAFDEIESKGVYNKDSKFFKPIRFLASDSSESETVKMSKIQDFYKTTANFFLPETGNLIIKESNRLAHKKDSQGYIEFYRKLNANLAQAVKNTAPNYLEAKNPNYASMPSPVRSNDQYQSTLEVNKNVKNQQYQSTLDVVKKVDNQYSSMSQKGRPASKSSPPTITGPRPIEESNYQKIVDFGEKSPKTIITTDNLIQSLTNAQGGITKGRINTQPSTKSPSPLVYSPRSRASSDPASKESLVNSATIDDITKMIKLAKRDWEFKSDTEKKLTVSNKKTKLFEIQQTPDGKHTEFTFPKEPALTAETAQVVLKACKTPILLEGTNFNYIETLLKESIKLNKPVNLSAITLEALKAPGKDLKTFPTLKWAVDQAAKNAPDTENNLRPKTR